MLEKITNERAKFLEKGDTVVSPFSSPPFAPLFVTHATLSPTGERVFLRLGRVKGVSQVPEGWALATSFWLPPEGYKFNRLVWRWESNGVRWSPPTLADLGITRDPEGFVVGAE